MRNRLTRATHKTTKIKVPVTHRGNGRRRQYLGSLAGFVGVGAFVLGPGTVGAGAAPVTVQKVSVVLGFIAQPSRGGFFAAQLAGYYKKAGLAVNLIAGADVSPEQLVGAGRAQFGVDDADQILLAASHGVPIEAVATTFQTSPFILLYHGAHRLSSFGQLNGRTAYIFPGSLWWQYIVGKYHLTKTTQVAFSGSLQAWLSDSSAINQEYLGVADYSLHKDHVAYGYLPVSAAGWRAYSNVVFATRSEITGQPALVRSFVDATIKGWQYYRSHITAVDAYMDKNGAGVPVPAMDENAHIQAPSIYGGLAATHGVGYMTEASWRSTYSILQSLHTLDKPVDVGTIFTDAFLPRA